jgi:hypothetical protein
VSRIEDARLAAEIVERLNELIGERKRDASGIVTHPEASVAVAVERLLVKTVDVPRDAWPDLLVNDRGELRFLGLLNTIVGLLPNAGGGRIAAVYDGERLVGFVVRPECPLAAKTP